MPSAVFLMMSIFVAICIGAGWRKLGNRTKLRLGGLYVVKIIEFGAVISIEPPSGFGREWWVYGAFSGLYTVWLTWLISGQSCRLDESAKLA